MIFLFAYSCGGNEKTENSILVQETEKFAESEYPENYSKHEFIDSNGIRNIQIDSLQYKISWRYPNDHFKIKHIIDTIIKIDSFYTFNYDTLTSYGLRTYPNNADIGIWKVKTKQYQDSIIDHDARWKCNYYDALKIAEKEGFELPCIEVSEGSYSQSSGLSYKWHIEKTDCPNTSNSVHNAHYIIIEKRSCIYYLYNKEFRQLFPKENQKHNEAHKK